MALPQKYLEELEDYSNTFLYNASDADITKFPDITDIFWQFLAMQKKDPESCFICVNYGMRRSGKTHDTFGMAHTILINDVSRTICLFRAPESLFKLALEQYPNRVVNVRDLVEVPNNCILIVDEALLELNAKLAMTTALRQFGQSLVETSHKRIIVIVSAQDDGVMKDLRRKADMVIYKRLSIGFVDESGEKFIQENKKILLELPKGEAIIYSNYFSWTENVKLHKESVFKGRVKMPFESCPWWSAKVSRNLEEVSMDRDLEEKRRVFPFVKQIAEELISVYSLEKLTKKKNSLKDIVLGYYLVNDLKKHQKIYPYINSILKPYLTYLSTESDLDDEDDTESDFVLPDDLDPNGLSFGQYIHTQLLHNIHGQILYKLMEGWTQGKIAETTEGKHKADINEIIHTYSETQLGYWLEDWFSYRMGGGETAKNTNGPDFIDALGRVFSIKYRYSRDASLTFYQEPPSEEHSNHFRPEYNYCKDHLIDTYYGVLYNPQWKTDKLKIVEVKTYGENKIILKKNAKNVFDMENP